MGRGSCAERLRKMTNGKEAGKDQVNNETLKAGDETIAKQLAKLYTQCIKERSIHKTEGSKCGDLFQEREQKRHKDQFACHQICINCSQKS